MGYSRDSFYRFQELYDKVGPHHYDRADVHFDPNARAAIIARLDGSEPKEIAGLKVENQGRLDGYLYNLAGGGWLLIRFSGTEPLMRIYTEVPDEKLVKLVKYPYEAISEPDAVRKAQAREHAAFYKIKRCYSHYKRLESSARKPNCMN